MDKVLLITAFPPSERAAAEKNTKLLLRDLSRCLDVDLIYFKYSKDNCYAPEAENIRVKKIIHNSLRFKLINVILHPFLHPYFSVRYRYSIQRYINSLVNNNTYKTVIIDHSQLFLYGKCLKSSVQKILIAHDVMAQKVERKHSIIMAKICRYSEGKVIKQNNAVVSTFNQKDVDLIKKYYNINAILCYDYIDERIIRYKRKSTNGAYVFFGNWKRPDNYEGALWFFEKVAPLITEKTIIKIIGTGFPIDKIHNKNDNVIIENLGFMDDPYPIIAECRALLSPLFSGAGIKVKVIEALACGTPVIGTSIAFEGFESKFQSFMYEASTPESFYAEMKRCNKSLEERQAFKDKFVLDYQSMTIPGFILSNFDKDTNL